MGRISAKRAVAVAGCVVSAAAMFALGYLLVGSLRHNGSVPGSPDLTDEEWLVLVLHNDGIGVIGPERLADAVSRLGPQLSLLEMCDIADAYYALATIPGSDLYAETSLEWLSDHLLWVESVDPDELGNIAASCAPPAIIEMLLVEKGNPRIAMSGFLCLFLLGLDGDPLVQDLLIDSAAAMADLPDVQQELLAMLNYAVNNSR